MKNAAQIPSATYRLQFNKDFTFRQARELVPYLHRLGISHIYASPYFKAVPGSMHGYDIADHNALNPEIGTREEYDALVEELHRHGMGQIVDFVPNHMGIGTSVNPWWTDVLENGQASVFAPMFDIDWHPLKSDLENKVLLPILGDQYGRVLERGEFKLEFEKGAFFLRYFENRFPLAPRSYAVLLKPALEKLKQADEDAMGELQSILTALEHLPERTDPEPEKIKERAREKEIIKKRLERLCAEYLPLPQAIGEAMRAIEGTVGNPRSFDALDELLKAQCYRLSYWRVASEEINYRRFFDINTLAAIRMELPPVFDAAHRFIFELIEKGAVNGLRIDHVDGLWLPRDYLEKLQHRACKALGAQEGSNPLYLLVEKILLGDERLRGDWPVHGTTGYDFTNEATGLFVDGAEEHAFSMAYEKFIGDELHFDGIAYDRKRLVMLLSMAGEINVLAYMLDRISEKNRWYRDFTLNALTRAVRETVACFPVYRAYVESGVEPSPADREAILRAVRLAKRRNRGMERSIFNFLGEILLMKFPENIDEADREEHIRFVLKLQQISGPVMAKGVEDTTFYIYNRLAALNEVGGEPDRFGISKEDFFANCKVRLKEHPHAMLATTTHDTKRSEDTRARLAAISEFSAQWRKSIRRWEAANRKFKREIEGERAPDANEEYLIYQTLLGTWPLESLTEETRAAYVQRIQEYMIKALKEAKVNTSWIQPNEEWENATREFVAQILQESRFLKIFEPFAAQVAQAGMINSLSQLVLKATVPGVPDFYQGTETWDFSLVDPDNRRSVDYGARAGLLDSVAHASTGELFSTWKDGRIKAFLTGKLLNFRRDNAPLFLNGDFQALKATGAYAENAVVFARQFENKTLLVIAPRLTQHIGFPPIGKTWRDTAIEFPDSQTHGLWTELFSGETLEVGSAVTMADALKILPVAVYVRA